LYAEEALEILKKIRYSVYLLYWYECTSTDAEKISDEDCEKLGLDPHAFVYGGRIYYFR
jgi:hypothetical protein